jgi:hypothetical protein
MATSQRAGNPAMVLLVILLYTLSARGLSQVVISQIYGGGGNSGAPYSHDFIELFNQGGEAIALEGWSVQYASASGSSWQLTALSGEILPHQWFLIVGTFGMSATGGKVALVDTDGVLTGPCPSSVHIIDFAGWGSASCFLGSGPAPGTTNTSAVVRLDSGLAASGDNSLDFTSAAPEPHNSQNAPLPVRVVALQARLLNANTVELTWTTLSEVHNFGFYVERRKPAETDFTEIYGSFQEGYGTTLDRHDYRYVDSAGAEEDMYRLRQVDLDGTDHFTEPVQAVHPSGVTPSVIADDLVLTIAPNPFNPMTGGMAGGRRRDSRCLRHPGATCGDPCERTISTRQTCICFQWKRDGERNLSLSTYSRRTKPPAEDGVDKIGSGSEKYGGAYLMISLNAP